jgi:AraC-like DNA-binding protein
MTFEASVGRFSMGSRIESERVGAAPGSGIPVPRRAVTFGVDRLPPLYNAPRHQHSGAYVTVVFAGAYEQIAYAGRLRVGAGDLLVQPTFDCHSDHMASAGVELLRIPWRREVTLGGVFDALPVEAVRQAAARDVAEAVDLVESLLSTRVPRPPVQDHWSDELAAALATDSSLRIADWAEIAGLSREAVSRGFRAHYGTTPARFRTELRARSAWVRISGGSEPLAVIAHDLGFADQAHMTRAVKWLTGSSPGEWRVRSPLSHLFTEPDECPRADSHRLRPRSSNCGTRLSTRSSISPAR